MPCALQRAAVWNGSASKVSSKSSELELRLEAREVSPVQVLSCSLVIGPRFTFGVTSKINSGWWCIVLPWFIESFCGYWCPYRTTVLLQSLWDMHQKAQKRNTLSTNFSPNSLSENILLGSSWQDSWQPFLSYTSVESVCTNS